MRKLLAVLLTLGLSLPAQAEPRMLYAVVSPAQALAVQVLHSGLPLAMPIIFAGGFTSPGGGAVTSASMIDPYVPVDGTMNVTGALAVSSTIASTAITATDDIIINAGGTPAFKFGASAGYGVGFFLANDEVTGLAFDNDGTNAFGELRGAASKAPDGYFAIESTTQAASGAFTVTAARSNLIITCSNAGGCAATLSETGAINGAILHIYNASGSAGSITIAESAGVVDNFPGAVGVTVTTSDAVTYIYRNAQWELHKAVVSYN